MGILSIGNLIEKCLENSKGQSKVLVCSLGACKELTIDFFDVEKSVF